ncbi:MAG TPA: hypothetical protein VMT75_03310 [Candidatus Saccharimonadales bacterium]|nr:hypothetical protein [Candidatus Saccharimonadales bacterium]
MTLLFLAFLVAFVLGWTLFRLSRADRQPSDVPASSSPLAHPSFVAEAVFSPRDWLYIQQESSASLNALFLSERRAIAVRWLRDCLAAIRVVRANHLRQSRHSQDLNLLAEAKLLLRFSYLATLCRCLLFAVQFVHPSAPHAIAQYVQNLAADILPTPEPDMVLSSVAVREVSRQRLG